MNSNYELAHKEIIRDYLRTTNRQTKAKKKKFIKSQQHIKVT